MAKSKSARGEKTQAIRQALQTHPQLKNRELVAMLSEKGIHCSSQDVANQKARLKMKSGESAELTLDTLLKIKSLVQESGGMKAVVQKINQLDALAEKVGGLAKLRKGLEVLPQLAS